MELPRLHFVPLGMTVCNVPVGMTLQTVWDDLLQPVQWSIPSWPAQSRHSQLITVMAGPDRPSLYSFFRASAGLVRAARRVWRKTASRDMRMAIVVAMT